MRHLVQIFNNHAVPCLENVAKFNRASADMFCRTVTGIGIERRTLFTDGDSVLYSFRSPVIVNGLALPSTRPDFLDRCIVFQLKRIQNFLPIAEQEKGFELACPRILGAVLDLTAEVCKVVPKIANPSEFRMADFARYGRAVATILGDSASFDTAYRNNRQILNCEIVEDQAFAMLVKELASVHPADQPWIGSARDLQDVLVGLAKLKGTASLSKFLPKSARDISIALGELVDPLKSFGVSIAQLPRRSHLRPWSISQASCELANESLQHLKARRS
jgi:hypothetical protein